MKIVVIGAGAAGLLAAGKAAETADEVVIIEKNDIIGKKLLITGKGRCNITNSADIEDMIGQYPRNAKFLYSALYTFTNDDIIRIIEENGVKTKVERGGRVFPVTDKSQDVVKALKKYALKPNVSLIPVLTEEKFFKDIMGLSLRNIKITAFNQKNKKVYSDFGEMLFTHFGISGPVVLSMSAYLKNIGKEKYKIEIDLKPALTDEQLNARVLRDFEKYSKKHLVNSLDDLLPKALIPIVISLSGIEPHKAVNEITREERNGLVHVLKHFTLTAVGVRPVEEAIVTAGGVKVSEINPSTMESKLVSGLYFAGEVIDIDGYTGGYNLQAAFSTGYLAGMNAAE